MAADIAIRPVIDRRHLYASASITSTFFNRIDGTTLPSRPGTIFVIQGANNELYFVTNRHMVDYNFNLLPATSGTALSWSVSRFAATSSPTIWINRPRRGA